MKRDMEVEDEEELEERWDCGECLRVEDAPIDEVTGEKVEKIVGRGGRKKIIETVVCPDCGSDDWHSESIRDLLGGANES